MRAHFNDFLLIPCALPWVLWAHALLGWRERDAHPSGAEILGHLLVWALLAEGLGPLLFSHAVGDVGDVVAYSLGAAGAAFWWRFSESDRRLASATDEWVAD